MRPRREGTQGSVAHLGFLFHRYPGFVNRLEVGGVAVGAPQTGVRVPNLTWQQRVLLLPKVIDPCGEKHKCGRWPKGWQRRGCAPYACGLETLDRMLTHPKSADLKNDDIMSTMLLEQKPAPERLCAYLGVCHSRERLVAM